MQMTDVEKERCKLAEHIVTEHTVEPTFKPRHQVGVRLLRSTTCSCCDGADADDDHDNNNDNNSNDNNNDNNNNHLTLRDGPISSSQ